MKALVDLEPDTIGVQSLTHVKQTSTSLMYQPEWQVLTNIAGYWALWISVLLLFLLGSKSARGAESDQKAMW